MSVPARPKWASAVVVVLLLVVPLASGAWPMFRKDSARTGLETSEVGDIWVPGTRWTSTALSAVLSSPVVVDVRGDARPEVFFAEWGGRIVALDPDGTTRWTAQASAQNGVISTPLIADVDLDGALDLVVTTGPDGRLVCYDAATGELKWAYTVNELALASPVAGDLDGDASNGLEIAVPMGDAKLHVVHGKGTVLNPPGAYWTLALDGPSAGSASLADLDGDGRLDVAFVTGLPEEIQLLFPTARTGGGSFYAVKSTGTVLWSYAFPAVGGARESISTPAIGDLDEDGVLDVAAGSGNGRLYVWAATARGTNPAPRATLTGLGTAVGITSPAIGDVDGDGRREIVLGTYFGMTRYALSGSSLVQEATPYLPPLPSNAPQGTENPILSSAALADVNGDGVLDVVSATAPILLDLENLLESRGYPGTVFALDGATWAVIWKLGPLDDMIVSSPAVADLDGDGSAEVVIGEGFPLVGTGTGNRVRAIQALNPMARFDFAPELPTTQQVVTFTDRSRDNDDAIVAWSWTFGDGATSTLRNPTHRFVDDGAYVVNLTVTDAAGRRGWIEKTVVVLNVPPTVDPVAVVDATDPLLVHFDARSADLDGVVSSHAWTFGDGGTSAAAAPSYAYATGGTYTASVTATDDDGATASGSVTVSVNRPPALDVPASVSGEEGVQLVVDVAATDADGDSVSLAATGLPPGASFADLGGGAGRVTWTPGFFDAGAYSVAITATDTGTPVRQATATVAIEIANVNRAPVFDAEPEKRLPPGVATAIGVRATDPDGDALTLAAESLPDGATFDATTGILLLPAGEAGDAFAAALTATDGDLVATLALAAVVDADGLPLGMTWFPDPADDVRPTAFTARGLPEGAVARWTFGDGGRASGAVASHRFADDGDFPVTLYAKLDDVEHVLTTLVPVANVAPTAAIDAPAFAGPGDVVTFRDASVDLDGVIVAWAWTLPDGSTATTPDVSVGFPEAGTFEVTLTVTDDDGATDTTTRSIAIDGAPPVSTASAAGTPGANGWFTASPVTVTLRAHDPPPGPSGVASIRYSLDGGAERTYSGPFAVAGAGRHEVLHHARDVAGNVEATRSARVNIDLADPVASILTPRVPLRNPVLLKATVSDSGSGVDRVQFLIEGRVVASFGLGGAAERTLEYEEYVPFRDWGPVVFTVKVRDVAGRETQRAETLLVGPPMPGPPP